MLLYRRKITSIRPNFKLETIYSEKFRIVYYNGFNEFLFSSTTWNEDSNHSLVENITS